MLCDRSSSDQNMRGNAQRRPTKTDQAQGREHSGQSPTLGVASADAHHPLLLGLIATLPADAEPVLLCLFPVHVELLEEVSVVDVAHADPATAVRETDPYSLLQPGAVVLLLVGASLSAPGLHHRLPEC